MALTELDLNNIKVKISPVIGKSAWNVALGEGSFITMEFGAVVPAKHARERPHGEWHLWIYCCAWFLSKNGEILVASEDEREKIVANIQVISGLSLISVDIRRPAFETTLVFEDDVNIHLFPVFSEGYEHWMLYAPDGNVLVIGPGTDWSYVSS